MAYLFLNVLTIKSCTANLFDMIVIITKLWVPPLTREDEILVQTLLKGRQSLKFVVNLGSPPIWSKSVKYAVYA